MVPPIFLIFIILINIWANTNIEVGHAPITNTKGILPFKTGIIIPLHQHQGTEKRENIHILLHNHLQEGLDLQTQAIVLLHHRHHLHLLHPSLIINLFRLLQEEDMRHPILNIEKEKGWTIVIE